MSTFPYPYSVIGGDSRSVYLAALLGRMAPVCHWALCSAPEALKLPEAAGQEAARPGPASPIAVDAPSPAETCPPGKAPGLTAAHSLPEACRARVVLCPLPLSRDGVHLHQTALKEPLLLDSLAALLSPGQTLMGGLLPKGFSLALTEKGVAACDLMEDESLARFNTLATAEGVIAEAIAACPFNLRNSRCLVLGYGRCGATLAHYLKGIGCRVSVFSCRKEELAQASLFADSTGGPKDLDKLAAQADLLVNTIPAPILSLPFLQQIQPHAVILDIASAPGGVDFARAKELGLLAKALPGLPGKYSPLSSARAIRDAALKTVHPEPSAW